MRRRPGRPKRRLVESDEPITRRVRQLVDLAHGGNLSHASLLTGISYPTVRDLYGGQATEPSMRTLNRLRAPYGLPVGWLLGVGDDEEIPIVGRLGLLPPRPGDPQKSRVLREVLIPFRAWSMYRLFSDVAWRLEQLEAVPDRPIVGAATGDAFIFRLTTFLMQPLLATEKLGAVEVIVVAQGTASRQWSHSDLRWIERLRHLGTTWLMMLPAELTGSEVSSRERLARD